VFGSRFFDVQRSRKAAQLIAWRKLAHAWIVLCSPHKNSKEPQMPNVGSWKIESEGEADEYLKDLLSKPEYRRVDELLLRAQAHVPDKEIRVYFINKGREMLRTYGIS
jgi:hypothetical protein